MEPTVTVQVVPADFAHVCFSSNDSWLAIVGFEAVSLRLSRFRISSRKHRDTDAPPDAEEVAGKPIPSR